MAMATMTSRMTRMMMTITNNNDDNYDNDGKGDNKNNNDCRWKDQRHAIRHVFPSLCVALFWMTANMSPTP
jgi:hypothetical protein